MSDRKPTSVMPAVIAMAVLAAIVSLRFGVQAEYFFAPIPIAFWLLFRHVCPERESRAITRLARVGWCTAQIVGVALMLGTFFVLAPWTGALTREDAIAKFPNVEIPAEWPVVVIGHGKASEFRFGTIESNPIGFGLTLTAFCALHFLIFWADFTGRGIRYK